MAVNKIKKLGVLGGMGSQATQYFFYKIIENTEAKCDQDYVDMVIINQASTPDRTTAILSGDDQDFMKAIEDGLVLLEKCKVDCIAIPCNTTHYFFNKIQAKTNIPIINMVKEVVEKVLQIKGIKKIGILATDGTIRAKVYEKECEKHGVQAVIPSKKSQRKIMDIIYNEIKKGEKGDYNKFMEVVLELKEKKCDVIIIACTELSYLKSNYNIPEYCVDALEVLAKKSILLSGKKLKTLKK